MDFHKSISYSFGSRRRESLRSNNSSGRCAAEVSDSSDDGDRANNGMVTEYARLPSFDFDPKLPAAPSSSCTNTSPFSRDVMMDTRVHTPGFRAETFNNDALIARPKSPPPSRKSPPPPSYRHCITPVSSTTARVNTIFHSGPPPPPPDFASDIPDTIECTGRVRTIEITPGTHAILRGAAETEEAVRNDFFSPVECPLCNETIFCIADADMYLCPECRSICPTFFSAGGKGGVGLGFDMKELARIQRSCLNYY